jgi:hypothetical protein
MKKQKTKLEQLLAVVDKMAITTFRKVGQVTNGWICETNGGNSFIIYTPWPDKESKIAGDAFLRHLFAEKDVIRYVHVAEVWTSNDSAITDSPADRREAVLLSGGDRDTGQVVAHFRYIVRPAHGGAMLSPPESIGGEMLGRFCNMFEPLSKWPTHH